MSEDALDWYAVGSVGVLVLGIVYAMLRLSWPVGVTAALLGSPAPFFGVALHRYEASLPAETTLHFDEPFIWMLLTVGGAMSAALALYLLVDITTLGGARWFGSGGAATPRHAWRHPADPRGEPR